MDVLNPTSKDLNSAAERNLVQSFTIQTVARLSPVDSKLPQVLTTCDMVKRGIGVHHGGLLPILKEMVEILFSRGLVKILFGTLAFRCYYIAQIHTTHNLHLP